MEGVSQEAASIAGHLGLGQASSTSTTTTASPSTARPRSSFDTEDTGKRFEAYGWHVAARRRQRGPRGALGGARRKRGAETARPSLVVVRSHIAYPAPHAVDTAKAHGAPLGEEEVRLTKQVHRLRPGRRRSSCPTRSARTWRSSAERGGAAEQEWRSGWTRGRAAYPELARERELDLAAAPREGWREALPRLRGRRRHRDARCRPQGDAGARPLHTDDDRRRRGPDRVDQDRVRGRRRLLGDPRRSQHRLRHPRARDGRDRQRHRARRRACSSRTARRS